MLHTYRMDNAAKLHDAIAYDLAYGKPDVSNATDVQNHVVTGLADSFSFDYDLAGLFHTERRWNQLAREYVDPEALELWLDGIEAKLSLRKRGVAVMRTRSQTARRNAGAAWRTWGSCMLAYSFRRIPAPTITLHSRTSYFGFLAPLDIGTAYVAAQEVSERIGIPVEDMQFAWHIEVAQFHGFKSMAWHIRQREQGLDGPTPPKSGGLLVEKTLTAFEQQDRDGVHYGDMSYGQQRRARKRWHAEFVDPTGAHGEKYAHGSHAVESQNKAMKKLPPFTTADLSFDCIRDWPPTGEASTMVETSEDEA